MIDQSGRQDSSVRKTDRSVRKTGELSGRQDSSVRKTGQFSQEDGEISQEKLCFSVKGCWVRKSRVGDRHSNVKTLQFLSLLSRTVKYHAWGL